jgi:hypothetical protein
LLQHSVLAHNDEAHFLIMMDPLEKLNSNNFIFGRGMGTSAKGV